MTFFVLFATAASLCKPAVISVFTKAGYALSWLARAERLGITPERLCAKFKAEPQSVKADWAALTAKKV